MQQPPQPRVAWFAPKSGPWDRPRLGADRDVASRPVCGVAVPVVRILPIHGGGRRQLLQWKTKLPRGAARCLAGSIQWDHVVYCCSLESGSPVNVVVFVLVALVPSESRPGSWSRKQRDRDCCQTPV